MRTPPFSDKECEGDAEDNQVADLKVQPVSLRGIRTASRTRQCAHNKFVLKTNSEVPSSIRNNSNGYACGYVLVAERISGCDDKRLGENASEREVNRLGRSRRMRQLIKPPFSAC